MNAQAHEIRKRLQERKDEASIHASLMSFLVSKGVCASIAKQIIQEFKASHHCFKLQQALMRWLNPAAALTFPCSLLFMGPTGVGKSTSLFKLANFYQEQDKKVVIVDLDHNSKLKELAQEGKYPYFVDNLDQDFDVCLIDTPGCNYYQPKRVEELGELIANIKVTERVLTLSASTKDVDIYGAIHQFSCLEPASLMFTKLDETLAGGILFNVCQKTSYPLRFVAYGYPLPGKVELADPKLIVNKIVTEMNSKEFYDLRQLIME